MKKMTILFTILCASQLYGMRELPYDIRHEIVKKAIESSDTLDDAVKAANVACTIQGACYENNLANFTRLVGMLHSKFPTETRKEITKKLNTSTVKEEYMSLVGQFIDKVLLGINTATALENAKILLDAGVDPNYDWGSSRLQTSLLQTSKALKQQDQNVKDIIDLLIKYGAKK